MAIFNNLIRTDVVGNDIITSPDLSSGGGGLSPLLPFPGTLDYTTPDAESDNLSFNAWTLRNALLDYTNQYPVGATYLAYPDDGFAGPGRDRTWYNGVPYLFQWKYFNQWWVVNPPTSYEVFLGNNFLSTTPPYDDLGISYPPLVSGTPRVLQMYGAGTDFNATENRKNLTDGPTNGNEFLNIGWSVNRYNISNATVTGQTALNALSETDFNNFDGMLPANGSTNYWHRTEWSQVVPMPRGGTTPPQGPLATNGDKLRVGVQIRFPSEDPMRELNFAGFAISYITAPRVDVTDTTGGNVDDSKTFVDYITFNAQGQTFDLPTGAYNTVVDLVDMVSGTDYMIINLGNTTTWGTTGYGTGSVFCGVPFTATRNGAPGDGTGQLVPLDGVRRGRTNWGGLDTNNPYDVASTSYQPPMLNNLLRTVTEKGQLDQRNYREFTDVSFDSTIPPEVIAAGLDSSGIQKIKISLFLCENMSYLYSGTGTGTQLIPLEDTDLGVKYIIRSIDNFRQPALHQATAIPVGPDTAAQDLQVGATYTIKSYGSPNATDWGAAGAPVGWNLGTAFRCTAAATGDGVATLGGFLVGDVITIAVEDPDDGADVGRLSGAVQFFSPYVEFVAG